MHSPHSRLLRVKRLSSPCPIPHPLPRGKRRSRRGAALVFSVFLVATILIVSAVAVDYARISTSRTEVKRTADAAAMGACWELYDTVVERKSTTEAQEQVSGIAAGLAASNLVQGTPAPLDKNQDIVIGQYDFDNPSKLDTSTPDRFNAVQIRVRKTDESGSPIPLFFGSVTGRHTQSLQTTSTAAMFKSISGFHRPGKASETLDILPIALDLETWEQVVAKQTEDKIAWVNGVLQSGSDGYCECSLYPTGTGSPGNRGTVDIGSSNNSTSDLRRQITDGISQQDMDQLGKSLEFDASGEIELNGDTGISAGIKAQLAEIVGQKRIIPIFTKVQGNGNNAMYTIVRWEGIRILGVKLTGPMSKKHLTIQPAPMVAKYSIYKESDYQESSFLYTPVMLVD